jgi:hypothetical protein
MTHFISQEFINDLSICDDLIDYHKNSPLKYSGKNSFLMGLEIF